MTGDIEMTVIDGYEAIKHEHRGERRTVRHAKLLMVAEHGLDVFDDREDLSHEWAVDWENDAEAFEWAATGFLDQYVGKSGYPRVDHCFVGEHDTVHVHRLLFAAEHGLDALDDNTAVHHKNGVPWDNRPDNLQAVDKQRHREHHLRGQRAGGEL